MQLAQKSRLVEAMSAWSVKTRRAPSRYCMDARVYCNTTKSMHGMSTPPLPRSRPLQVCQGRPYAPGRLQRYPNVTTSSGPYRAVCSYRGGLAAQVVVFDGASMRVGSKGRGCSHRFMVNIPHFLPGSGYGQFRFVVHTCSC